MSAHTGEATQRKLQALWDKLCPKEPRTIVKARIKGYQGRRHYRLVWIGERVLNGDRMYVELGVNYAEAAARIQRFSHWKS